MGSERSSGSAELARISGQYSQRAYDTGFAGLQTHQDLLANAEAEPGYLQNAFEQQRTGLAEGAIQGGQGEIQGQLAASQGAAQGGNTSANLTNSTMGARMAQALHSSRLQESLGKIEQANKLMGMRMGQSVQAGSEALGAAGNQLRDISMTPNYNPTYASVLAGLNTAGSIYGGFASQGGGGGNLLGGVPPTGPDNGGASYSQWGLGRGW